MKKFLMLLLLILFFSAVIISRSSASESSVISDDIREKERKITENISEQVEKQMQRVTDPAAEKKLSEVTAKIKPHMGRELKYEVRMIKRDDPHAFSLPGGLTYITTGMLDFLRSDHELSAVLAREFTHSDLSHWLIQSSRNEKIDFKKMAEVAAATQSGKVAGNMVRTYLNRAVINFYDIDLEKETDLRALEIMQKAGQQCGAPDLYRTYEDREIKQLYVRGIDIRYKSGFKPLETVLDTMKFLRPKDDDRKPTDPVHTDMIQANTDMEERVSAVLAYFKENNIEIKRKYVLNVLIPNVKEGSDESILTLDETVIMRRTGPDGSPVSFEVYKDRLNRDLQLETPQYDIQIQTVNGTAALLLSGRPLIYEKDIPDGSDGLSHIREKIVKALTDARRENFLTDYYE